MSRANLRLQAEIAERQATEAALRQAQKLEVIGQLTGGIAHDFNNLFTIVNGNLTLAMERVGNNSGSLLLLRSAVQAAERGGALIHRLLAFARKQRLDPESVNLSHLVGGIEDLIRRTLRDRVGLAISSDPDLSPARVDAGKETRTFGSRPQRKTFSSSSRVRAARRCISSLRQWLRQADQQIEDRRHRPQRRPSSGGVSGAQPKINPPNRWIRLLITRCHGPEISEAF